MHKTKTTSPEAPGSTIHTAGTLMALWLFCVLFYFIQYFLLTDRRSGRSTVRSSLQQTKYFGIPEETTGITGTEHNGTADRNLIKTSNIKHQQHPRQQSSTSSIHILNSPA